MRWRAPACHPTENWHDKLTTWRASVGKTEKNRTNNSCRMGGKRRQKDHNHERIRTGPKRRKKHMLHRWAGHMARADADTDTEASIQDGYNLHRTNKNSERQQRSSSSLKKRPKKQKESSSKKPGNTWRFLGWKRCFCGTRVFLQRDKGTLCGQQLRSSSASVLRHRGSINFFQPAQRGW